MNWAFSIWIPAGEYNVCQATVKFGRNWLLIPCPSNVGISASYEFVKIKPNPCIVNKFGGALLSWYQNPRGPKFITFTF